MLFSNITTFLLTSLIQFAPLISSHDLTQTSILPATKHADKLYCPVTSTDDFVPGSFLVKLCPGHSLHQHSTAIGTDIEPYIRSILKKVVEDGILYVGVGIGNNLLDAILGDEGVLLVECNAIFHMADGVRYRILLQSWAVNVVIGEMHKIRLQRVARWGS
jgi:hypothetical protein